MERDESRSSENCPLFLFRTLLVRRMELPELRYRGTPESIPKPAPSHLHLSSLRHCDLRPDERGLLRSPDAGCPTEVTDGRRVLRQPDAGSRCMDYATGCRLLGLRKLERHDLCLIATLVRGREIWSHAGLLFHDQRPLLHTHSGSHLPRESCLPVCILILLFELRSRPTRATQIGYRLVPLLLCS